MAQVQALSVEGHGAPTIVGGSEEGEENLQEQQGDPHAAVVVLDGVLDQHWLQNMVGEGTPPVLQLQCSQWPLGTLPGY